MDEENMLTILGWYTFVLMTLSILLNAFGNDKPLKRFVIVLFACPVWGFAYVFLFFR